MAVRRYIYFQMKRQQQIREIIDIIENHRTLIAWITRITTDGDQSFQKQTRQQSGLREDDSAEQIVSISIIFSLYFDLVVQGAVQELYHNSTVKSGWNVFMSVK